jgi:preprotein translocase subunit SecA
MVTRSLESAQRKVEQRNFDIRKQLLEYDDVANDQRKVIYQQRNELLETTTSPRPSRRCARACSTTLPHLRAGRQRRRAVGYSRREAALPPSTSSSCRSANGSRPSRTSPTTTSCSASSRRRPGYADKVALVGAERLRHGFERNVMLQSLDTHWREHLSALDHLRQGIHLRGYAQKNPKQEYKREAFELFESCCRSFGAHRGHQAADDRRDPFAGAGRGSEPHAAVENVQYHHADYDEALGTANPGAKAGPAARALQARRSAATIPVPAVRARNTSTATASSADRADATCRSI